MMMRREFTPAERLCHTSVSDAQVSLDFIHDIDVVRSALAYERTHFNRSSLIKIFEAKIRKMEKAGK